MQTFLEWFWERFPDELQGNRDIECYDRVMEQHPNHNIWYNLGLRYKQRRLKDIFAVEVK
ncbi:MAG: hypothetical protein ACXWFB_03720 [Nitrososphaeraceae archaeon]